jgi:hypothetical protein
MQSDLMHRNVPFLQARRANNNQCFQPTTHPAASVALECIIRDAQLNRRQQPRALYYTDAWANNGDYDDLPSISLSLGLTRA